MSEFPKTYTTVENGTTRVWKKLAAGHTPHLMKESCPVCGKLCAIRGGYGGLYAHKGPCKLPCSGANTYQGYSEDVHGKNCPCKKPT